MQEQDRCYITVQYSAAGVGCTARCTLYTVHCTAAVPLGPAAAGAVLEPGVSTRPATLGTTATPHTSTVISEGGVVTDTPSGRGKGKTVQHYCTYVIE